MLFTTVVFPTPGPPVTIVTLAFTVCATAARWDAERVVFHFSICPFSSGTAEFNAVHI